MLTVRISDVATALLREIHEDPSLLIALAAGCALTAFLVTAHACCIGLTAPDHLSALLQICSGAR